MKAQLATSGSSARCLGFFIAFGLAAFGASCSSSTGSDPEVIAAPIVQNLTLDRTGHTVVATLQGLVGDVAVGSIEGSAGQAATSVAIDGEEVTVVFDARVTPSHQVRFVDVDGVADSWRSVTTSDPRAPRMGVQSATQDTSDNVLGGDEITLAYVDGPRIIQSEAEDIQNWTVTVEGVELDLDGSSVSHDPATQVTVLTLGPLANLHSSFRIRSFLHTVADTPLSTEYVLGAATGDNDPPALRGGTPVLQEIDPLTGGDEFGRVISIQFDEPISPVFGATASNFAAIDHAHAVGTTSVTRVAVDPADNTRLLVSFSRPVVPGFDQIRLDGIVDAHGNELPLTTSALVAGSTVPNGFASLEFVTVPGLNNDVVVAELSQAIDPDTADDPALWDLEVGGNPVDLTAQTLEYSLAQKTLTITLDFDETNGTLAELEAQGVTDVDGESFAMLGPQMTASGDSAAPTVTSTIQNRTVATDGTVVDVYFSEALEFSSATNAGHYTFSPAIGVTAATLVDDTIVRLALANPAIPGDFTLTVAQAVSDPAGNDLGADFGPVAFGSTDGTPPSLIAFTATAVEGIENDEIIVLFDDRMIESEIEDVSAWTVESPVGTALDLTGSSLDYDPNSGVAHLVLDAAGAPSVRVGQEISATISTVRDIGGNTIDPTPFLSTAGGEMRRPAVDGAFLVAAAPDEIIVRFSEPMDSPEVLYDEIIMPSGVRYAHTDSVTNSVAYPVTATRLDDGLGVELTYAASVDPLGTLDVVGSTDLAGNVLFPTLGLALEAENVAPPAQDGAPAITALAGTSNDSIVIAFDVPMASWKLTDPGQYAVTDSGSGTPVDLANATIEFDGTDEVTVTFGPRTTVALQSSSTYDVTLQAGAEPLRSVQGVPIAGPDTEAGVPVTGDTVQGPTAAGSAAYVDANDPNALIVLYDETVDEASATTALAYNFGGGMVATNAASLSPRSVRVTFPGPVTVGGVLDVTPAAAVDTAGNAAAGTLSLSATEDMDAPSITTSDATIAQGVGGDVIRLEFSEEVRPSDAQDVTNYTVATSAGLSIRVVGALYDSQTTTATLFVEDVSEGEFIDVAVEGVRDLVGNAPATPLEESMIATGDQVAPAIVIAYVNYGANASGTILDVRFTEDVNPAFLTDTGNWSTNDGRDIIAAEVLAADHVRLVLNQPQTSLGTLGLAAGLSDTAGNTAGFQTVTPLR